jgi:hypothetical protein
MRRRICAVAFVTLTATITAGCSSSPHEDSVRTIAVEFVTAIADQDGEAACSLLTERARQSVTGATDATCADAIINIDQADIDEAGDEVHSVEVWGDAAQVKVGDDVIFLREQAEGWQVRAAGCTKQSVGGYDCDIEG